MPFDRTIEPPFPPDVRRVGTAIELQRAVQAGHRDIELVDHLDLRALPSLSVPIQVVGERHIMYVANNTRSIRVRILCLENVVAIRKRETPPLILPLLQRKRDSAPQRSEQRKPTFAKVEKHA
jgi:hypothetical protein